MMQQVDKEFSPVMTSQCDAIKLNLKGICTANGGRGSTSF